MKTIMNLCFTLLLLVGTSCSEEQDAEEFKSVDASANSKSSTAVFNAITGEVIGTSILHRNSNGVTVNFKTTDLMPGHTYTLWWVVWNNPENCIVPGECTEADFANALDVEVQLLYAAGHVAGNNGKGNFSGHLNENDDGGSIHELFGLPNFGGLHNAESAEIHVVLRSHGPAVPGIINEQIGSYLGGCPTTFPYGFPPFTEIPDEVGECGDIIAALHRL